MNKLFVLLLLLAANFAHAFNIGDAIPRFEITDQFDQVHTIKADTQNIIVAGDKDTSSIIRDFLLAQDKGFLAAHQAYYVADISGMPSLISKFFALPKMRKYPFSILLLDDSNKDKFSKKEDHITIYTVSEGKISEIKYIKTATELAAVFE
ncbi:hypothetical protein [Moritella viscosa]|uniref:Uncharacterized protein n=1 Tax=Moritella viscosa TaxID=80854 RepID=A0A090IJ34_9GAMM|nr:hypothetical protein [Moritella viscosa]CED60169.1 putative exported protein [Moritella viscosa]SGY98885.1 Putative uncharacterized protein [Moritella viscosa]SGZ13401.1 Putative uncharacterized protein [Moritella viscosa]SGZ13496.1 Putative uncharacterized protein [Moritella viscosa]SHO13324.1 Putative uncharacterized protein [Moritella viscosa]